MYVQISEPHFFFFIKLVVHINKKVRNRWFMPMATGVDKIIFVQ
jgi:hypothetical protein